MSDFSYSQLEKIMSHDLVNGEKVNIDKYGFTREFEFSVSGRVYRIVWFKNQSTLIFDDLRVMFNNVEIANTWPSPAGSKQKLQFRDAKGECVAILVIDWFKQP